MNSERLVFELSPQQIKTRNILNKDFLEIEMWAISDVNPNRNNTHFTLESLEKALPRFKNKPILGFFNKGDFEEHNGDMRYDKELDMSYWDTEHGERILGVIRESDKVEIVEKDGLHWIRLTCVLYVQYCYKQVKKLLRDKSKKISVEINVLDSIREDGIQHIKDFNLLGITILGSKNGVPVMEGIQGAHLSLLDRLDEAKLGMQQEALCFAYRKMDKDEHNVNTNYIKEESAKPTMNRDEIKEALERGLSQYSYLKEGEDVLRYKMCDFTENCVYLYDCENNACEKYGYSSQDDGNMLIDFSEKLSMSEEEAAKYSVTNYGECDGDCGGCGGEPEDNCDNVSDNCVNTVTQSVEDPNVNCDLTVNCDDPEANCVTANCDTTANCDNGAQNNCDYEALEQKCNAMQAELEECKAKMSEYCDTISAMQAKLDECGDYAEIKEKLSAAEAELCSLRCAETKRMAQELMNAEKIVDEDRQEIEMNCDNGKYSSREELEKDIAYAAYKARSAERAAFAKNGFTAPIINNCPVSGSQNNKHKSTRDERLANYAAGNRK